MGFFVKKIEISRVARGKNADGDEKSLSCVTTHE